MAYAKERFPKKSFATNTIASGSTCSVCFTPRSDTPSVIRAPGETSLRTGGAIRFSKPNQASGWCSRRVRRIQIMKQTCVARTWPKVMVMGYENRHTPAVMGIRSGVVSSWPAHYGTEAWITGNALGGRTDKDHAIQHAGPSFHEAKHDC